MRRLSLLAALPVIACLAMSPLSPARADAVTLTGEVVGGSGRISFVWPAPVRYSAQRIENRLIVTFARPIEADFAGLAAKLPGIVKGARVAADGRTVVLELEKAALLRSEIQGSTIIFDLADPAAPPAPTTASRASAPPAASPPAVAPQQAAAPPPAPVSPSRPAAAPPASPSPAAAPPAAPGSRPQAAAPTPSQPAPNQPAANSPVSAPAARPPSAPPPPAPASSTQAPAPPAPTPSTQAAPPAPAPAPAPASPSPAQPAQMAEQAARPPVPASSNLPQAAPMSAVTPQAIKGTPVPVRAEPRGESMALRFEWPAASAAAVFRRAGFLWAVFDQPGAADLSPLQSANTQVVAGIEQVPSAVGMVMRMAILPGVNPHVERDGLAWVLELRAAELRPDISLQPEVQKTGQQGLRMFIPVGDPADPVRFVDPEVGDTLQVVPVAQLGRGIDGERQYIDFHLLATAQGVVIKPLNDDLLVRSLPDGVALSDPDGLDFTSPDLLAQMNAEESPNAFGTLPPGRVFDMVTWRRGNPAEFQNQKQALQRRVAEATRVTRSQPRLDLAEFYFAHGLAAEAVGLLRTIEVEDPDLAGRPDVLALRGATKFMLNRYDEASAALFDASLNGKQEVELWRGATMAALGDYPAAMQSFSRAGTIPPGYPANFVTELALLGAEAALRNRDFRTAGAYLDAVNDTRPGPADQARVDYFRGRIFAAAGDFESASEIWTRLTQGEDRWSRIRSELAMIDEQLARNGMTRAEAIQKLESLRFIWRGDRIELEMLRKLGQLYLEEGDIRNGLTVMKQAASAFPESAATREVTRAMTEAFTKLYIEGGANALPPLAALALYEDFRELTPPGPQGNEMINRLADRLVAVELLERAANLLDRQVKSRLEGGDKARVGARLAVIRLLDRKPDAAIKALDDSQVPNLPADIAAERARLRSRALFELERPDEALRLIATDMSRDADLLRADITWKTARWKDAVEVFQRLVGPADANADRTVDEQRAQLVLNLAVSMTLAGESGRLQDVRTRFSQAMDRTQFREAFRLITNPSEGALNDYSTLAARFQEFDRFQAFMASYKDKLKAGLLSAIN